MEQINRNITNNRRILMVGLIEANQCDITHYRNTQRTCLDKFCSDSRENPEKLTIKEPAERLLDATGSCCDILHVQVAVDDPRQRRPDKFLAPASLDWKPTVELRDGVALTTAHSERVLGAGHAAAAR